MAKTSQDNKKAVSKLKKSGDPDFVFHIGANKTGSSAIQNFMRVNVDVFNSRGFYIPDRKLSQETGVTGEHVFALEDFFRKNNTTGLQKKFDELHEWAEGRKTLISAENLSNLGRSTFFKKIGNTYNVKVILYIRRQDELLTSSWQQWHSKVHRDFNAWLVLALQRIGHWERTIKAWEDVAGKGNINVRIFDRSEFPDGNILSDFLNCLDIQNKSDFSFETRQINPSYSDIITPLVAGNRNVFQDSNDSKFYQMIRDLTGEAYSRGKKISLLTRAQRESVVQFFSPQNERVCKEYFENRPQLFKPVDHSKYEYLSRDDLQEEQLRFLTHMVHGLYNKLQDK